MICICSMEHQLIPLGQQKICSLGAFGCLFLECTSPYLIETNTVKYKLVLTLVVKWKGTRIRSIKYICKQQKRQFFTTNFCNTDSPTKETVRKLPLHVGQARHLSRRLVKFGVLSPLLGSIRGSYLEEPFNCPYWI